MMISRSDLIHRVSEDIVDKLDSMAIGRMCNGGLSSTCECGRNHEFTASINLFDGTVITATYRISMEHGLQGSVAKIFPIK